MKVVHGAALVALVVLAGCSGGDEAAESGDQSGSKETLNVVMTDNRFEPDDFDVAVDTTVTFEFHNDGTTTHEAYIGAQADQDAHAEQMDAEASTTTMSSTPESEGTMDDHSGHGGMATPGMVVVEPGEVGELTHRFDEPGKVLIGCHQPGHYDSGMVATVNVS